MNDTHSIRLEESGPRGRYVLRLDERAEAELVFSRPAPDVMAITHTEVPARFEGQGLGRKLVERAVADARAGGFKIRPYCSYVVKQFARTPEWADVHAPR